MSVYNSIFIRLNRGPEFRAADRIIGNKPIPRQPTDMETWLLVAGILRVMGLANVNREIYEPTGRKVGTIELSSFQLGDN